MTLTVLLITARVSLSAQTSGERGDFAFSRTETTVPADDRISGLDRWAFRINALELLCTVPNINIEFDLSSSPFNRWSLGLTAKYNWNTTHSVPPPLVFNMFEIRPEFRRWYRLSPKEGRSSAANERAFFVGGYIHGGTYSIKPGTYGIQGPLWGAGALWGYEFPLYTYRHFAIDFELGFAAGLGMTSYTGYSLNRSGSDYIRVPERSKGLHLCPFPIVSELRACFVFRSLSVKEKYKKVDAKKLILKQERDEAKRLEAERRKEIKAEKKALRQQQRALKNADVEQKGKRK